MKDFLEEIAKYDLAPLWEFYEEIVTDEPNNVEPSVIWKWSEMLPLIEKSTDLVQGKAADHRVLILKNPNFDGKFATTKNIVAAYQCVMPGEKTSPHRHTPAATRVIIEGTGGGTFVNGKRCPMYDGDLIITPNWTWHCHENDSTTRAIWLDILDIPLVNSLDAVFGEMRMGQGDEFPENNSTISDNVYTVGGMVPASNFSNVPHSPRLRYAWQDILSILPDTPFGPDGSQTVRYTNPLDGTEILPTHGSKVLALTKNSSTTKFRSTANAVCIVIEGQGSSEIGNVTHTWGPNDIFTIPHWSWTTQKASTERALMIVISDQQIMEKLNLYKEEVI